MHYSTFVIIGRDADPEPAVATALQPFDEDLEVEPYHDYLDASEIQRMAERYRIPPTALPALARKMEDWRGREGSVDAHGLYALTTYNPDGKFDWYEIGGRWDGYIKGSRHNVISAKALHRSPRLRKCLPYYLATPDGRWLEHEDAPLFGAPATSTQRRSERRWLTQVRRVLKQYIHCKVVCVDIHS